MPGPANNTLDKDTVPRRKSWTPYFVDPTRFQTEKWRTEFCKFFESGKCLRGGECHYAHSQQELHYWQWFHRQRTEEARRLQMPVGSREAARSWSEEVDASRWAQGTVVMAAAPVYGAVWHHAQQPQRLQPQQNHQQRADRENRHQQTGRGKQQDSAKDETESESYSYSEDERMSQCSNSRSRSRSRSKSRSSSPDRYARATPPRSSRSLRVARRVAWGFVFRTAQLPCALSIPLLLTPTPCSPSLHTKAKPKGCVPGDVQERRRPRPSEEWSRRAKRSAPRRTQT
jgi:hypothetical protein